MCCKKRISNFFEKCRQNKGGGAVQNPDPSGACDELLKNFKGKDLWKIKLQSPIICISKMCFYLNLYHFSAWFDSWPLICEYHSRCLTTPITVRRFHAPCSVKVTCMSVKRFKFYISEKQIVWKITVEYNLILGRKIRFW